MLTPHCHDSQCAVKRIPHSRQPSAESNSPTKVSSRLVAAVSWLDSSTISASSRSNGAPAG